MEKIIGHVRFSPMTIQMLNFPTWEAHTQQDTVVDDRDVAENTL